MKERTFVMIKPNAIKHKYMGEIIHRIEVAHYQIIATKMLIFTNNMAEQFYHMHIGKPFFNDLQKYICSGPVVGMIIKTENAVKEMRELIGNTDPLQSHPGTIRHDYGDEKSRNAIHASDSIEAAKYEISLIFNKEEIYE